MNWSKVSVTEQGQLKQIQVGRNLVEKLRVRHGRNDMMFRRIGQTFTSYVTMGRIPVLWMLFLYCLCDWLTSVTTECYDRKLRHQHMIHSCQFITLYTLPLPEIRLPLKTLEILN